MITATFPQTVAPFLSNTTSRYPAQNLTAEQRKHLAIQMLSGNIPVTELSGEYQVSRNFLYELSQKASNGLDNLFFSPDDEERQKDKKILYYIPVTKSWLDQVVVALVLLCRSSFRRVMEFFQDILDKSISIGTVHNIIHKAVSDAQQINSKQDLSRIKAGSHDELFQSRSPVLTGIDLDSTYCYLLALETHRDADTWGVHLLDLLAQGLHPNYTIADGGLGLRAGQSIALPSVPCFSDVFHALYETTKTVIYLENQAYASIAKREELEKKMEKAKRHAKGRSFSKQLSVARYRESILIRVVDDLCLILQWMQKDILAVNELALDTRKSLFNFITDELKMLEDLSNIQRISKLRLRLENQRDDLLGFATLIDQGLQSISERFQVPVYLLRDVMSLKNQPQASPSYYDKLNKLHKKLHDKFFAVHQAIICMTDYIHRTSSMVENLNSRLRDYFFLRQQIGSSYLDLLRFFFNHHPFTRSEHPERVGKTPAELLNGEPHLHWLELLGFTLFKRNHNAA